MKKAPPDTRIDQDPQTRQSLQKQNGNAFGNKGEFRIIVIGASAGGVEAIGRVIAALPPDLPAAVFVVLHISPTGPSFLPEILNRIGRLPAQHARDGAEIEAGRIYIAPQDHHLLIKPGKVLVSRGPRENNARPAVDPLFRTAARAYGRRVIGVILSGGLDDGTLGLMDVKSAGGIALVQNPDEAMFPSMPNSAIENVPVDQILGVDEIGPLLTRLARQPLPDEQGAAFMARHNSKANPDVAEVGNDDMKSKAMKGPPSKFTCPECGGALWELQNGSLLRYRCHVGHGYTADTLMVAQNERLEDALWGALRALEESAGMRRRMAVRARKGGWEIMAKKYDQDADHVETRASLVRSVLVKDKAAAISADSARGVEARAAASRDPDANSPGFSEIDSAPVLRQTRAQAPLRKLSKVNNRELKKPSRRGP